VHEQLQEERPKDLEMPKADIEDMVPSVDAELARGADSFVLGSGVQTINRANLESEDDKDGNMRFHAIALLKALTNASVESEEFVCDMLSTLTLHRPYPQKFHVELLKTLQDHLETMENPGDFWKLAHTRMCTRISDEIESRKNKRATDDMFSAMVESVSNLKLRSTDDANDYVLGGIEWVMEDWESTRAAFLDAMAVQVKKLDREQTSNILSNFDQMCRSRQVPMDTSIEDAEFTLPAILKFRQFLQDQTSGMVAPARGRAKGASTPKAKGTGGLPKARLTFTPTQMSSQGSIAGSVGAASSSKGSGRGSAASKRKYVGSDDEDAEGWVEAPSRGSSQASSADGKRRK